MVRSTFPNWPCCGFTQYIARLVANEHSNGGSTSTVVAVRLSRGRDADNASHVPKTRGRTDEEFRRRNLQKIPLALLDAACCKLVLLTHSTKFVFLPLFLCFLPQHFLLSIRNAFLCPALRPYRRPPKQQKKHSSHSSPMNISGQHCSQKIFQGFAPKTRFEIAAFTQPAKKHLCDKTTRTPSVFCS